MKFLASCTAFWPTVPLASVFPRASSPTRAITFSKNCRLRILFGIPPSLTKSSPVLSSILFFSSMCCLSNFFDPRSTASGIARKPTCVKGDKDTTLPRTSPATPGPRSLGKRCLLPNTFSSSFSPTPVDPIANAAVKPAPKRIGAEATPNAPRPK